VEIPVMFQGSMVALVTPMQEGGAIDDDRLQQRVDFNVKNHTDALVAVGTTGESATLGGAGALPAAEQNHENGRRANSGDCRYLCKLHA